MKQRLNSQAFTIIEIMMVLAISAALLVAALILLSGQQAKTEFSQAVRDIQSQINDTIKNVSDGYYPNTNNFTCSATNSGPVLSLAPNNNLQGTNSGCIFIGNVLQFAVAGSSGQNYNTFTVVGLRQVNGQVNGPEVTSLSQTVPTAIAQGVNTNPNYPNDIQTNALLYGLNVTDMYINDSSKTKIGAVGFFSSIAPLNSSANLASGTTSEDLMAIGTTGNSNLNSSLNSSAASTVDNINNYSNYTIDPPGGVTICFQSGGTNQFGLITIGGNNGDLTTSLSIQSGTCS